MLYEVITLLEHFRSVYAAQSGAQPFEFDAAADRRWIAYPFPGNVRELRNIVIRLTTKHPGQKLGVEELEPEFDLEAQVAVPGVDGEADRAATGLICWLRNASIPALAYGLRGSRRRTWR